MSMTTIIRGSNGISLASLETRLFSERKIFLEGDINYNSASELIKKLMILLNEDSEKAISIYINSDGGEVGAGLMIYNNLKSVKSEIYLYGMETVASMAAIIFGGGQKGRRLLLPNTEVMIHEPKIIGSLYGNAEAVKKTADSIAETKSLTVRLLASDTKKKVKEIEAVLAMGDYFMNANEAVEFGIADGIVESIL